MPKIKFTQAYQVHGATFGTENVDPNDSPSYAEGETVEVNDASAQHFISRGVAELVGGKKAVHTAPVPAVQPQSAPDDYESMHVDELHKLASEREIEGRSGLTTKADLVKALEKNDKAGTAKAAAKK